MSGFVDANIMLRYLLGSPEEQARRAGELLDQEEDLPVSDKVLDRCAAVEGLIPGHAYFLDPRPKLGVDDRERRVRERLRHEFRVTGWERYRSRREKRAGWVSGDSIRV